MELELWKLIYDYYYVTEHDHKICYYLRSFY